MEKALRATWRAPRFRPGVRTTDTVAQFRDVTRLDPMSQIDNLRRSIDRIEKRLFRAAKAENADKVGKLASLLANQRARVQMLADKLAIDGPLPERIKWSRDRMEFKTAFREDLGLLPTGKPEARAKAVEPLTDVEIRDRNLRTISGKRIKRQRFKVREPIRSKRTI